MDYLANNRKKALFTTVPMSSISIVNQIPGRKIKPKDLDSVEECILLANNESFLGGRSQPAIGLHFIKENVPSIDVLEFPQWVEYERAIQGGYDVVGIGFYTTHFYDAVKMARMAREAGVKEVWAGNYGALTPGTPDFFDRSFTGYAEGDLKFALDGKVLDRVQHPIITTSFSAVLAAGRQAGYLFTTRGCKFRCKFCCSPVFSPKTCTISLDEIERVLDVYRDMGIDYIDIGDETFLQHPSHARKVIDLLSQRGLKWFCTSRADLLLGQVEELKEKGLDSVYIGIESLNDNNLADQRKGQSIRKVIGVLDELKQNGISTSGTYILGLLHDTVPSIKRDLEKLNELPLNILIFLVLTPYPELPIYKIWKEEGRIINDDWRDYDGLHLVFRHPSMTPVEARQILEYAVCNIYGPHNYNKRRVLQHLDRIRNSYARSRSS